MPLLSLDEIIASTGDEFKIIAQLGQTAESMSFLALQVAEERLVVLLFPSDGEEMDVLLGLGDEVPANRGTCTSCRTAPTTWGATCPTCRQALAGAPECKFTVDDVRSAAAHEFDTLGVLVHLTGGTVFFAHARDGQLVALVPLAVATGAADEYSLEAVWEAGEESVVLPPVGREVREPALEENAAGSRGWTVREVAPDVSPAYQVPPTPSPRRSSWLPLAIGAALVLVTAVAWATWPRDVDGERAELPVVPPPAVDSAPLVAATDTLVTADTLEPNDGRPTFDSAELRDPRRDAAPPTPPQQAVVVIDDRDLPTGWTRSVNGGSPSNNLTVRLWPGRGSALIRVQALGYCPESTRVVRTPGDTQRWAPPKLRKTSMVSDC